MAPVVADMSMSLDGFVADADDGVEHLFGWYFNGDVEVRTAVPKLSFRTSEASAAYLQDALASVGALIAGRRSFDLTGGWGGRHPMGVPVFVVTHTVPDGWAQEDGGITFVIDGVESAVAQAKAVAGDRIVGVASPTIAQQCLNAGLLDGISVNLVPVLLGEGVRLFDQLMPGRFVLEDPEIIESVGVTHLYYRVLATASGLVLRRGAAAMGELV